MSAEATTTEFAKLFTVDGRQVLVFLENGDDHDYQLHQIARASFGMVDNKTSFNVSKDAPESFDVFSKILGEYSEESAREFVREIEELETVFSLKNEGNAT